MCLVRVCVFLCAYSVVVVDLDLCACVYEHVCVVLHVGVALQTHVYA